MQGDDGHPHRSSGPHDVLIGRRVQNGQNVLSRHALVRFRQVVEIFRTNRSLEYFFQTLLNRFDFSLESYLTGENEETLFGEVKFPVVELCRLKLIIKTKLLLVIHFRNQCRDVLH